MRQAAIALSLLIAGALAACDEADETDGAVGLANPASVFCADQGGKSEIRTAEDGSKSGICILPDGTEVDEWAYFREHHPEAEAETESD
jgi:putative hemolysin